MGVYDFITATIMCPVCKKQLLIDEQIKIAPRPNFHRYTIGATIHGYREDNPYPIIEFTTPNSPFIVKCDYCENDVYYGFAILHGYITDVVVLNPGNEQDVYFINLIQERAVINGIGYQYPAVWIKANALAAELPNDERWNCALRHLTKYNAINGFQIEPNTRYFVPDTGYFVNVFTKTFGEKYVQTPMDMLSEEVLSRIPEEFANWVDEEITKINLDDPSSLLIRTSLQNWKTLRIDDITYYVNL